MNQIEKCILIGKLYKNTVFRQILVDDCRRIIHIIQKCNYEDLLLLKDFEPDIEIINNGKFIHSKLGVTNLLPIPPLDGGKIVLLIVESIRKKPLRENLEIQIQMAGFVLMIVLTIFVTYKDILRIT